MHHGPDRDVKTPRSPGAIFLGLVIFGMAVALLTGNVALYELRQENLRLEQQLEQRREELRERRDAPDADLSALIGKLELSPVDPDQIVVIHVRQDPESPIH